MNDLSMQSVVVAVKRDFSDQVKRVLESFVRYGWESHEIERLRVWMAVIQI